MRRIGTQDGLFILGNPATQTQGTTVTADWLNALQEELAGAVEGLGGTLDPADNGQLFDWLVASFANIGGNASQAFRAALAARFDDSSYVATTEFVNRVGLQAVTSPIIYTNTTLTASAFGASLIVGGSGTVITLPLASVGRSGARIEFINPSAGFSVSIVRQGTDPLSAGKLDVSGTGITLGPGDTITLEVQNGGWYACGGSALLKYVAAFDSSLAANGYQKLPGGLIFQWGTVVTDGSNNGTWTHPVAFPNAAFRVVATVQNAAAYYASTGVPGLSSTSVKSNAPSISVILFGLGY